MSEIFNDNAIKSLLNLANIMNDKDPKLSLYNLSVTSSDYLLDLINNCKVLSTKEKLKYTSKFNLRKINQLKVEKMIKKANNINID